MKKIVKSLIAGLIFFLSASISCIAQQTNITSATASVNSNSVANVADKNIRSGWDLASKDMGTDQWLMLTLQNPGDVKELLLTTNNISAQEIQSLLDIYITYDPMNLGNPVKYTVERERNAFKLSFTPKYGAHVRLSFRKGKIQKAVSIKEIGIFLLDKKAEVDRVPLKDRPYMNPDLPLELRVESLLSVMTTADKMELLREGWGIPGVAHLGIPPIMKVEAIHGFSYGSGATIFPQAIGMGATWNKKLTEEVAMVIGDETVSANAVQAWSPVLDVAQDARWGRCEETYGEDPVLVSQIGGAWIKGYQSKGLMTTPKHFAAHGAPLGGRDSHDIGLSEREMREIHLVPFRHVIKNYKCQSLMMAYSDYLGVPVAKSKELLKGILRDEWGFDGFIVSDCGALGNLTSRKHYTAKDRIEAAKQALAAGIATNCGDTYNDPEVIAAAIKGELNMDDLDFTCRTMLYTLFRNGYFEHNPSKQLDWNKIYPGWNSDSHKEVARRAARESMVLLENKDNILPLSKSVKAIAVIGPGADNLQPGDYTSKPQPNQLKSVLTGIRAAVGNGSNVIYEKGCDFTGTEYLEIEKAVKAAQNADVAVMVLGDCSTSEALKGIRNTSGENHDYASLILPGEQQRLLEAVCKTGKPVILILQAGRPYNLSYASKNCQAILVNWLPGQEGGPATADVLFGDYNPAGRLPMTFPRDVAQLPLYYNFKTSGRVYQYEDMPYYPLYRFGYGLSYTSFSYSNLKTDIDKYGNILVEATVTNTGKVAGDEVVQLYITDMYASVKTRVMELKDFDRLHLNPGESKTVSFTLNPYQLSLLNDKMDRVVEKGTFKIIIGGKSPSYIAADRIKDSVGFEDSKDGVMTEIEYPYDFRSDFATTIVNVENNPKGEGKVAYVTVTNTGTITDTGKLSLFIDGIKTGDDRHYDLDPNEEKQFTFEIKKGDFQILQFITKYKSVTYTEK
ncbi:glycoside hydrolase family 3 C-terminal domain-containing protein [Prevotella sp. 10(H)]|uniref:glycoside hydrolase family 3 C-terminal domain-containing protein n=1 Tax=Prevotella sp. 10(H) TaxID=1158294 RepID=UPI0004A73D2D|nr:glycoside hydrolase family 3 C-terminal domain-containing protein [Prevotella sp. 10(H)]